MFHEKIRPSLYSVKLSPLQEKGLVSFGIIFIGYLLHYCLSIVLAHLLGQSNYGEYAVVVSTLTLFGAVGLLGGGDAILKFLPTYLSGSSWPFAHGLTHFYKKYCLWITSCIFVIGLSFAILIINNKWPFPFYHIAWKYLWIIPFVSLLTFFKLFLRALNRYVMSLLTFSLIPAVFVLLALLVFHLCHIVATIDDVIILYVCSMIVAIITQIFIIRSHLPEEIFQALPTYQQKTWFLFGLKLFLTNIFLSTEQSIITLLLRNNWHNPQTVAVYTAVMTITEFLWLAYTACNSVVIQLIPAAAAAHDENRLQYLTNAGNAMMLGIGSVLYLLLIIFGRKILLMYGEAYVVGYVPMLIIGASIVFSLAVSMSVDLLEFAANPATILKVTFSISMVLIIAGIFLCHMWGLYGATLVTVLFQTILPIVYCLLVKEKLNIKPLFFV